MVITLDKRKKPLGFCTERRARILLSKKRACVYKYYPFTIIIKDIDARQFQTKDEYRIKIDPGANYTGIAIVKMNTNEVVYYIQIEHRGQQIVENLKTRNQCRRNRRQRETRYRPCKWINHYLPKGSKYKAESPRPEGWLPPSVRSICDNILNWVNRLCRLINITQCSFEAVRFNTQLMDNPEIEGVDYQHGTLFGYEVKEYLLDKYSHTCQYCGGKTKDPVLEWEHIIPKSRGGSDSMKNATLACHTCNHDKDNKLLKEWLNEEKRIETQKKGYSKTRKELAETRVKRIAKIVDNEGPIGSNRYCAWANASRKCIEKELFNRFSEVECASGGKTKFNRTRLNLPKDHHYDALCVGNIPDDGFIDRTNGYCLYIKAMGRGTRRRGQINKCGIMFKKYKKVPKRHFGFQNGDIVIANKPKGKDSGRHMGRVMTRSRGDFDVRTTDGKLIGVTYSQCKLIQQECGYQFIVKQSVAIPLGN